MAKLGVAPEYQGDLDSLSLINIRDATLQRVLPPIDYPWAFEFISDDEILLTQISGKLSKIDLKTGEAVVLGGLPTIGSGFTQIGLMDIELHPDYAANHRIYFSFAKPHPESSHYHATEVATGVIEGGEITQLEMLLNNSDFGWAPSNFGGALEFDDAGLLYITVGDRGEDVLSRRGDRLEGKLLRVHADGSIPKDNPYIDRDDHNPRLFAIGIRNAQGLHFDSPSGLLLSSDHGPLGGDEINIIRPGLDYGWPTISYGANYATTRPIGEGTHKEGLEQPIYYFLPSIAVSPLTVYRGEMFPEWDGDILVGALRGQHIARLDFDEGIVRSHQTILPEVGGRIRDIKVAGDGSIYILSQTSGLHRLYRKSVEPQEVAENHEELASKDPIDASSPKAVSSGPSPHPGKKYYDLVCSGCHDSGASGSPVLGDYAAWKPIMDQPRALTRQRVLNGYNAMPERGLCYTCSDAGLMEMVDYMFMRARKNAP
ncbi:MAG: PQQ-dependent sugar dehydrogenase [Halioglobus sp.]|nr:PQQ-dependent sugar dehydrogenase [Halioglobus sp.]